MRIITRYIFSEISKVFLLSLFILMAILILEKINFISNMTRGSAMGGRELLALIIYTSPAFLVVSIPLASMLASLTTFSRLSADNEITAMRAGGASFGRLLAPVVIVSALWMAFSLFLSLELLHKGNFLFNSQIAGYVSRRITTALGERVFFDKFPNLVMYVSEKPVGTSLLKGVFIFDSGGDKPRLITARQGYLGTMANDNIILKLKDGVVYSGDKTWYREIKFDDYEVVMDVGLAQRKVFERGAREMSPGEIAKYIMDRKSKDLPVPNGELVELSKRFSLPLACLVLGILGAPLGVSVHRGGRWGGVGIGILMIIVNYLLLMVGEGLGMQGKLNPVMAVFLPDIVMGGLAAYLVHKVSRS